MDFEFTSHRSLHFGAGWLLLGGERAGWSNTPNGVATSDWNPTASEDRIGIIGLLGKRAGLTEGQFNVGFFHEDRYVSIGRAARSARGITAGVSGFGFVHGGHHAAKHEAGVAQTSRAVVPRSAQKFEAVVQSGVPPLLPATEPRI